MQLPLLKKHGLFPARVLDTAKKGIVRVRLLNPVLHSVRLYPGMALASAYAVSSKPVPPDKLESSQITTDPKSSNVDPLTQLNLKDSDLSLQQQTQLFDLLATHRDQFSTSPEDIGQATIVKHSIDVGDHPPIRQKAYRLPESQKPKIADLITSMLKQRVISPSNSPWASPIVVVKKKDGTDRFCIDFCKLNQVTRKDAYPLPNITEILDQLGKAHFFSSLNLASGYWQFPMSDRDKEKTAFTTFMGLFDKKCSFGKKELAYLGHIISKDGVKPDPNKVQAV